MAGIIPTDGLRHRDHVGDYESMEREERPMPVEKKEEKYSCGCLAVIGYIKSWVFGSQSRESDFELARRRQEDEDYRFALDEARKEQEKEDHRLAKRISRGEEVVDCDARYGKMEKTISELIYKEFSEEMKERYAKLRELEKKQLSTINNKRGNPIVYQRPDELRTVKGIANADNSCAIASLLFSMLAATNVFDVFFFVELEKESNKTKKIREKLLEITNQLRSEEPCVSSYDLVALRYLVMDDFMRGGFLQPDEFLIRFFKSFSFNSFSLDWDSKKSICTYFSIPDKKLRGDTVDIQSLMRAEEESRLSIRRSNPGREEGKPIISNKKINQFLFIQSPRQAGYDSVEALSVYKKIRPSLKITVEGQKYKLLAVLSNINEIHYESWIVFPEDKDGNVFYYFNGGGVGNPKVVPFKDIYKFLECEVDNIDDDFVYTNLLKNGTFFIYVKDE